MIYNFISNEKGIGWEGMPRKKWLTCYSQGARFTPRRQQGTRYLMPLISPGFYFLTSRSSAQRNKDLF